MTNPNYIQPAHPTNALLHVDAKFCEKALTNSTHFCVNGIIGIGSFGVVFKVLTLSDRREMAVKVVRMLSRGEETIWPSLRNRYIVPLFDRFSLNSTHVAYVMPFIGKDLCELVYNTDFDRQPSSFYRKRKYIRDILRGLQYLHFRKLVHGDLKEENVVVCQNTDVAVIGDFTTLMTAHYTGNFKFGLRRWCMPPEVASESRDSEDFDAILAEMWTYGILSLQLFTKQSVSRYCATMKSYDNDVLPFVKSFLCWGNMKAFLSSSDHSFDVFDSEIRELVDFLQEFLVDSPILRSSAVYAQWHSFVSALPDDKREFTENASTMIQFETTDYNGGKDDSETIHNQHEEWPEHVKSNEAIQQREPDECERMSWISWWSHSELDSKNSNELDSEDLEDSNGKLSDSPHTFVRREKFEISPRHSTISHKKILENRVNEDLLVDEDVKLLLNVSTANRMSLSELGELRDAYREKYKHVSFQELTGNRSLVVEQPVSFKSNSIRVLQEEKRDVVRNSVSQFGDHVNHHLRHDCEKHSEQNHAWTSDFPPEKIVPDSSGDAVCGLCNPQHETGEDASFNEKSLAANVQCSNPFHPSFNQHLPIADTCSTWKHFQDSEVVSNSYNSHRSNIEMDRTWSIYLDHNSRIANDNSDGSGGEPSGWTHTGVSYPFSKSPLALPSINISAKSLPLVGDWLPIRLTKANANEDATGHRRRQPMSQHHIPPPPVNGPRGELSARSRHKLSQCNKQQQFRHQRKNSFISETNRHFVDDFNTWPRTRPQNRTDFGTFKRLWRRVKRVFRKKWAPYQVHRRPLVDVNVFSGAPESLLTKPTSKQNDIWTE